MKCENIKNYKYCKKRMRKTEIRYARGKQVCINCFLNQDKWDDKK